MAAPTPTPAGQKFAGIDIEAFVKATVRMIEILDAENALLTQMKVVELAAYREEKDLLARKLDEYRKIFSANTETLAVLDHGTRNEMMSLTEDLTEALEENLYRTTVARTANQRVLQTISEALNERHRVHTYGRQGQNSGADTPPLPLNLDQRA